MSKICKGVRVDGKGEVMGFYCEVEEKHYILEDAQVIETEGPRGIEVAGFVEVEEPKAVKCLYLTKPRGVGKALSQLRELIEHSVTEIHVQESDTQKNLDKALEALARTKANSYPGLAVKEGRLLNLIYKDVSKTLKEIGKR